MTLAQAQQPLVFIVSGPSGSGKSTLVQKMLEVPGTMFSVSSTTRPPRTTESAGKWYDFVSEEEFDRRVRAGEFLEHARVFDQSYGTPKPEVLDNLRDVTENLKEITDTIKARPYLLIRSSPPPEHKPGESK